MKRGMFLVCLGMASATFANDSLMEMRAYCQAMPTGFPQTHAPRGGDFEIVHIGAYSGIRTGPQELARSQFSMFSNEFQTLFSRRKNEICSGSDPANYFQRLVGAALESCQAAAPAYIHGPSGMSASVARELPALTQAQQVQAEAEISQFAETNCPMLRHHLTSHQANWSSIWQSGLQAGRTAPALAECGAGVNDDGAGEAGKSSDAPGRLPADGGTVLSE